MPVKKRILKCLAGGVAGAEACFDEKTGRFLAPNGGWAVTHQDRIFPLALLHETPEAQCRNRRRILELCLRGGDALRNWQDEEGRFEFIKVDGSRWGMTYMPWSMYHWLEAYVLIRDRMDARRRRRWEDGLTLAYGGLARERKIPMGHNIPTWHGMSLVRAGQVFDRPDWLEVGKRQVLFSAEHQHPDGFWSEGDGPTTGYNFVYVHAIGLYHAFTGDKAVLPALRRATDFHAAFTYPDGSCVETVDGRQKFHGGPRVTGVPGFSLFPKGRRLARLWLKELTKGKGGSLSPHLATAYQHMAEGPEAPLLHEKPGRTVYKRSALVRRQGPWFICVSGYVPPPKARAQVSRVRWIMTRANCLSVWHDKLGLLVGGGNSKHDPPFATFEVWADGAMRIEPDKVTFSERDGEERARFHFGDLACTLRLKPVGAKRLDITFETPPARRAQARGAFTMRLAEGTKLSWNNGGPAVLDPKRSLSLVWPADKRVGGAVAGRGWSLKMPAGSRFSYPVYPFNPYAIDNASPAEQAVAAVSTTLEGDRRRTFVLRVE